MSGKNPRYKILKKEHDELYSGIRTSKDYNKMADNLLSSGVQTGRVDYQHVEALRMLAKDLTPKPIGDIMSSKDRIKKLLKERVRDFKDPVTGNLRGVESKGNRHKLSDLESAVRRYNKSYPGDAILKFNKSKIKDSALGTKETKPKLLFKSDITPKGSFKEDSDVVSLNRKFLEGGGLPGAQALDLVIPGLGTAITALSPIISGVGQLGKKNSLMTKQINDHYSNMDNQLNPYKGGGKLKKYGLGEELGKLLFTDKGPNLDVMGQMLLPGLSAILDTPEEVPEKAMGGKLKEDSTEDMLKLKGKSHEQGGIEVSELGLSSDDPVAEVEGDETIAKVISDLGTPKKYVFSKRLKL